MSQKSSLHAFRCETCGGSQLERQGDGTWRCEHCGAEFYTDSVVTILMPSEKQPIRRSNNDIPPVETKITYGATIGNLVSLISLIVIWSQPLFATIGAIASIIALRHDDTRRSTILICLVFNIVSIVALIAITIAALAYYES